MKRFCDTPVIDSTNGPLLERYRYVKLRWRLMFAVVDFLGAGIFRLARALSRLWTSPVVSNDPPRSILVIQLDHLGDAIITLPMLRTLRRGYPAARIEVLAAPWNCEVFAACPEVDRIHVSRLNRFSRVNRFGWPLAIFWWAYTLRARKFDLGIDVRGEFPFALLMWLAGVRRRVGWSSSGGEFMLTDSAPLVRGRNETYSRFALLEALRFDVAPLDWRLEPGAVASREIAERLARLSVDGKPLLALHIGAGTRAKRWPAAHWRELLGRIATEFDALVVLLGTSEDQPAAREILDGRDWPQVADWTGALNIVELAALLEQADVFVGADSGPAHLAAAMQTPTVVLFSGANDPRVWAPVGGHVTIARQPVACSPCHRETCPWSDHPCMRGLAPESVMGLLRQRATARSHSDIAHRPDLRLPVDLSIPQQSLSPT
jgi:lipopolysaccharide heptosyltransferase II